MSEEEKKAIEITKTIIEFAGDSYIPKENRNVLQTLLNLIEKQFKVIDEMAGSLYMADTLGEYADSIEEIKKYFYRKVSEEND